MASDDSSSPSHPAKRSHFATTRWSVVRAAGRTPSPQSREALETLFSTYWYPIYAYLRRRGHQPAEAQDVTQGFLTMLLEGNLFRIADPDRGRFRSFLLKSLQNFVTDEARKAKALKRGGGRHQLSLDFAEGEERYVREPADEMTPERIFERRWALALIEQVMALLRDEYERRGKLAEFESLQTHLSGDREQVPYSRLAEQLGMTEGAVRVAAHRMRRRYRELLRAEIAHTVASTDEVDDELRQLMQCLGK